jgi:ABC-2 type transport system permease protein
LGGFVPSCFILLAFALLFGGRLSFEIAVINQDQGQYGQRLVDTFDQVISPLDLEPYYAIQELEAAQAWQAYNEYRIEGIWVIPTDFTERITAGDHPEIEMHFINYNDDRAKNHRIYAAEVMWQFYQNIGVPDPPLALSEEYPLPVMVDWVSIISVGIVLLSVTLGSIFNMFILTYKSQISKVTLEIGLTPRSLAWVLIPKTILALLAGLVTGTFFLILIRFWLGFWPGGDLFVVWLIAGLVALFWIQLALALGLITQNYMVGAISSVLGTMIIFFIGGGLSMVRGNEEHITWVARLFPNTYAIDPIRDLVLFNTWPVDFWPVMLKLIAFVLFAVILGSSFSVRKLRRLD